MLCMRLLTFSVAQYCVLCVVTATVDLIGWLFILRESKPYRTDLKFDIDALLLTKLLMNFDFEVSPRLF
jgi:hypothetical protein